MPDLLLAAFFYVVAFLTGYSVRSGRVDRELFEAHRLRDKAWDLRHGKATAERNEAWRFIAALAADGPLVVTDRALAEAPDLPEFVKWTDPATRSVRVRLVNGKGPTRKDAET